jgi:hypothetical protein
MSFPSLIRDRRVISMSSSLLPFCLAVSACGGGGGGVASIPPPPPMPTPTPTPTVASVEVETSWLSSPAVRTQPGDVPNRTQPGL